MGRNSIKRDPSVRGRHFTLNETRVWMRLHFWSVRECGLSRHQAFWNWYIQFIGHFVKHYSSKAVQYTGIDADWSVSEDTTRIYERNHTMEDF
jgi:hypothetical protein